MWGTLLALDSWVSFKRFIPTCVGNSSGCTYTKVQAPVHPHVCGELLPIFRPLSSITGSSPRVWGTRIPFGIWIDYHRFIPTCVGNSERLLPFNAGSTVHPHVCGELLDSLINNYIYIGSSPRVWGTP